MTRRLSVTVITLNEERNLGRCLASVAGLADEIVVLDCGSTDATEAVARQHGARFVHQEWLGHRAQKNAAIDLASHPWILALDADEWLDETLARAIREALRHPTAQGYTFERSTRFLGRPLHLWSPDPVLRLFHRDAGRFGGHDPHDRVVLDEAPAHLPGTLHHDSYPTVASWTERIDRYSAIAAADLHQRGVPFRWSRWLFSPLGAVARKLARRPWRDGWRGALVTAGSGVYAFLKYERLRRLSRQAPVPQGEAQTTL